MSVICLYCNNHAEIVDGDVIYRHRKDLKFLKFWLCRPCQAYVGTHKNSNGKPLGTLAKPKLRKLRNQVHALFDKIWMGENKIMRHGQAYSWFSQELGIGKEKCHVAMFNQAMCLKAIEVCKKFWDEKNVN